MKIMIFTLMRKLIIRVTKEVSKIIILEIRVTMLEMHIRSMLGRSMKLAKQCGYRNDRTGVYIPPTPSVIDIRQVVVPTGLRWKTQWLRYSRRLNQLMMQG